MKHPEFINIKEFFSRNKSSSQVEHLEKVAEDLKVVQKLTTKNFTDFSTLVHEYLKVGVDIFSMEIGIVSKIDGNDYIVCDAVSPDDSLHSGDKFSLDGTYCLEVFKTNKVIGLPHVGKLSEMKDHPVYVNMKLESYISSPIFKDGELFGTLNFSSTKPRESGFSEHEKDLIFMMANAIGGFLLLQEKENSLIKSNTRLKRLTGYLAHDLRNPLGNILSMAEIYEDLSQEEQHMMLTKIARNSKKALDLVHSILEASVLGDGKIILEKEHFSLSELLQLCLQDANYLSVEYKVNLETNIKPVNVYADKARIRQVFDNAISNAIKYAKTKSYIKINLSETSKEVFFEISNEINNSRSKGTEIDVTEHGSVGFGLEIMHELVRLHSSILEVVEVDNTFNVSFKLDKE